MPTKTCRVCHECKDASMFQSGRRVCRTCNNVRMNAWYASNAERLNARSRARYANNTKKVHKPSRFNRALTTSRNKAKLRGYAPCVATVNQIRDSFTGVCHVCGVPESECNKRLCLDHDHTTGEFRGWLCNRCNRSSGLLGDSPEIALALAEYLERNVTKPQ